MPSCAMRSMAAACAAMTTAAVLVVALPDVPRAQSGVERGTLRLHYVQKPIGFERYEITHDAAGLQVTADFDFTDRGGRIQLASTLLTRDDFTPIHFTARGRSYRYVNVDSDVTIERGTATVRADGPADKVQRVPLPPAFFTVDGYAPLSAQMLLLRYWNRHGRPRTLQ